VTHLDNYSQTLLLNLRRFQKLGDKSGAAMIGSSCVDCLAHLAVLCEVLGKIEPAPQTELDTLCDSTLERLGKLAGDMYMEEYTRLDLLLGVRTTCNGQTGTSDGEHHAAILEKGTRSL
jgi:hypothetical protein